MRRTYYRYNRPDGGVDVYRYGTINRWGMVIRWGFVIFLFCGTFAELFVSHFATAGVFFFAFALFLPGKQFRASIHYLLIEAARLRASYREFVAANAEEARDPETLALLRQSLEKANAAVPYATWFQRRKLKRVIRVKLSPWLSVLPDDLREEVVELRRRLSRV
jgi:hypothetical protein